MYDFEFLLKRKEKLEYDLEVINARNNSNEQEKHNILSELTIVNKHIKQHKLTLIMDEIEELVRKAKKELNSTGYYGGIYSSTLHHYCNKLKLKIKEIKDYMTDKEIKDHVNNHLEEIEQITNEANEFLLLVETRAEKTLTQRRKTEKLAICFAIAVALLIIATM